MSILRMPPLTTPPLRNLSSVGVLTNTISLLSIQPMISIRPTTTVIRMGGGPRTFPGGVSKWQWKRMQAKKQKQLLKARLSRERQIYEMRKRAELRAAVSELEKPWEVVERAPTLFSVSADEQLKTLADRFQRPGGFDLWSERDGPQLFHTSDGLPSARLLSKDAIHSVKPYGIRSIGDSEDENDCESDNKNRRRSRRKGFEGRGSGGIDNEDILMSGSQLKGGLHNLKISSGKEERAGEGSPRNEGIKRNVKSGSSYGLELDSKRFSYDTRKSRRTPLTQTGRAGIGAPLHNAVRDRLKPNVSRAKKVYDMSLKQDGSYELQTKWHKSLLSSGRSENILGYDSNS